MKKDFAMEFDIESHDVLQKIAEMNFSRNMSSEVLEILGNRHNVERNVSPTTEVVVITIYAFLIIVGLALNLLVTLVIVCRRKLHTPRNLYIVNLTACDISLCLICMPFTLVRILRNRWTLGSFLCKLVGGLPCTNVMMAVGTITVIAMDRYFAICYKPKEHTISTRRRIIFSIILIWTISLLASIPLFINMKLVPIEFLPNLVLYEVCSEQWSTHTNKIIYGISLLLVLAIIPPTVVATAYALIARHLRRNTSWQKNSTRAAREIQRNRRMTFLLSGIVIIFTLSWLPLGVYPLLDDLGLFNRSKEKVFTIFAIVHIFAMSTTLTNPIVYGWLNSNIRSELLQMFSSMLQRNDNMFECCEMHSREVDDTQNHLEENETVTTHIQCESFNKKEAVALLRKGPADETTLISL